MKPFEYAAPKTLREATALLADKWGETEILAGGTDLVTSLKQGITTPNRIVSLKNIEELKTLSVQGRSLRVGAMVALETLASHPVVRKQLPSLVTAIENIGSPQILAAGTVGGDLCQRPRCWYFRNGYGLLARDGNRSLVPEGDNRYHAIFANEGPAYFVSASSLGPALIALGATVLVTGPRGKTRRVAATEFFRIPKRDDERETVLQPTEIVTEIVIPLRGLRNATYEVRHRHGLDWPYVTASVAFALQDGVARDVRVVLGHVAPVPWVSEPAAGALEGKAISEAVAVAAGQAATQGARPLSRNGYKVQLVKTAVKRAVLAAAQPS